MHAARESRDEETQIGELSEDSTSGTNPQQYFVETKAAIYSSFDATST